MGLYKLHLVYKQKIIVGLIFFNQFQITNIIWGEGGGVKYHQYSNYVIQ